MYHGEMISSWEDSPVSIRYSVPSTHPWGHMHPDNVIGTEFMVFICTGIHTHTHTQIIHIKLIGMKQ